MAKKPMWDELMAGNARFANGETVGAAVTAGELQKHVAGQQPKAIVLSCVDSRVPPERVLDAGLGELLVIRTAGQVVDDAVLGSIEFGVAVLQIPLLLVLGHSNCGAVAGAIQRVESGDPLPGKIDVLAQAIAPAVQAAQLLGGDLLDAAVTVNARFTVDRLLQSPIIEAAVNEGRVTIAAAVYDLATGRITLVDSEA